MYIPFEQIAPYARVWVYQTNRQLTDNESLIIDNYLKPAISQWAAHGASLLASAKVLYNRFVIIALDENLNEASGCSIDASTRWFKELGESLGIDFFDRSQAYLEDNQIKTFSIFQAKKAIENNLISPETTVFINSINTLSDIESTWKRNAEDTYLKRHFKQEAI